MRAENKGHDKMIINLLTDEQFLRHCDGSVLSEVEKELLGRLKCKIELLDELVNIVENSDYIQSFNVEHGHLADELREWDEKLGILAKIEGMITK